MQKMGLKDYSFLGNKSFMPEASKPEGKTSGFSKSSGGASNFSRKPRRNSRGKRAGAHALLRPNPVSLDPQGVVLDKVMEYAPRVTSDSRVVLVLYVLAVSLYVTFQYTYAVSIKALEWLKEHGPTIKEQALTGVSRTVEYADSYLSQSKRYKEFKKEVQRMTTSKKQSKKKKSKLWGESN